MSNKDYFLSVRLSPKDRARLRDICQATGLSPSAAVRRLIAGAKLQPNKAKDMKPLYTEINRIGNNINQIARSVNAGIATQEDARQGLFLLQKVYDLMERMAED